MARVAIAALEQLYREKEGISISGDQKNCVVIVDARRLVSLRDEKSAERCVLAPESYDIDGGDCLGKEQDAYLHLDHSHHRIQTYAELGISLRDVLNQVCCSSLAFVDHGCDDALDSAHRPSFALHSESD